MHRMTEHYLPPSQLHLGCKAMEWKMLRQWDEERLSEANINIYQHSIHSSTSFSIFLDVKLLDHRPNQPPTFAALQALLLMAYSRAADSRVKQLFPAQIMPSPIAPRQKLAAAAGSSERQRNWTCWVVRIGLRESSQKSWESSWIISVLQASSSACLRSLVSGCCKSHIYQLFPKVSNWF